MAALPVCAVSPVFAYFLVLVEAQRSLRLSYCCLHVGQMHLSLLQRRCVPTAVQCYFHTLIGLTLPGCTQ